MATFIVTLGRADVPKVTQAPDPRPVAPATWVRDWLPFASVPAGATSDPAAARPSAAAGTRCTGVACVATPADPVVFTTDSCRSDSADATRSTGPVAAVRTSTTGAPMDPVGTVAATVSVTGFEVSVTGWLSTSAWPL